MIKKIGIIAVAALVVFVIFFMSMRRSHMMNGGGAGVQQDLVAVSSDGGQISSEELTSISAELPKNTAVQQSGELIVSMSLNPYPPSAGQPSQFEVTLTDLNGNPIDDASISLDLTMPSMWMPPNQPDMQFLSDGKYSTTAPFTMRGGWRIEVIITRGDQKQSVFFDVGL